MSYSVQISKSGECGNVLATQLSSFVRVEKDDVQLQGKMLSKVKDSKGRYQSKLKAHNYHLIGKELYVYRKKNLDEHKKMHNLTGVFLKDAAD